ncbi:hypothetical protein VSDG_01497 [Cytospora chrysosperma]|uniref:Uncharacterized protein n=1 Tax=Cytospora chrysosperma TaxID=252740 RepID=A0A423WIS5_CYTCH|nr:hypothetical protein VSDG_01497 [Valsa sordida]
MDWHNTTQALLPAMMESRIKSWGPADISTQQDCLFYNGRIPQEITDLIFKFALSPDTLPGPHSRVGPRHDFHIRYDHEPGDDEPEVDDPARAARLVESAGASTGLNPGDDSGAEQSPPVLRTGRIRRRKEMGFDWFRPECAGRLVFRGHELLRTCRRVYLDTRGLFEQAREVVIFSGREPPWGRDWGLVAFVRGLNTNYAQLPPNIRSIRWFPQMYLLERSVKELSPGLGGTQLGDNDGRAHLISQLSQGLAPAEPVWRVLHSLEHFHLTIRRTDWDRWEDNKALAINPYQYSDGQPSLETMQRDMRTSMVEGKQPPCDVNSWITLCRTMRKLKTLTISFETSEDKKDEMEDIVAWARTWRFGVLSWRCWVDQAPNKTDFYLIAEDKPARKMSWRGLKHHWSDFCSACGAGQELRPDCGHCLKKHKLLQQGKGPRLLVWTLTWRPEPVATQVSSEGNEPDN